MDKKSLSSEQQQFSEILQQIQSAKKRAVQQVNNTLVELYWSIGKHISSAHQFYTMENVFYLPETSRWSYIQQHAKQGDIAIKIDSALTAVEKSNASLKGALLNQFTATTYKLAKMNESVKLDEVTKTNLANLGYAQKKGVPARG